MKTEKPMTNYYPLAPVKFHLRFERASTVPCVHCELCMAAITDATQAMVYWQDHRRACDRPLVAHKRCLQPSQELAYPFSMELSTYLAFLLRNVGLERPVAEIQ